MTRTKMKVTIDSPPGGAAERLCESLREMGYTVTADGHVPGSRRIVVSVQTPYGEVHNRRYFGAVGRRRSA
jgi:hypothetical protein